MLTKVKSIPVKTIVLIIVCTLLIACWTSISAYGVAADQDISAGLELSRELSSEKILLDDEFTITYRIDPQPITIPEVTQAPKEIYLVMDTSGSMNFDLDGKEVPTWHTNKRIDIAREAANKFLDNLNDKENVKVGLISYGNFGMEKQPLTDKLNTVKNKINGLNVVGGTNIGDGLRLGYYRLKDRAADKYLILLTDGEPTYHSIYKKYPYNFYKEDGIAPDFDGGGSKAKPKDIQYCYEIAEEFLGQSDIKSYMIAFTKGSNANVLEQVAQKAGGVYKQALSSNTLNNVYQDIYEEIVYDFYVENIRFEETFPEGLTVVSAPDGFSIDGQTVSGGLGKICYSYDKNSGCYKADSKEFSVKLKGSAAGSYLMDSSELSYKDVNNENKTGSFGDKSVNVVAVSAPVAVERNLSKEEMLVDEEFYVNYAIIPGEFGIDPDLTPPEKFIVKNVSFSEEFPDGLTVVSADEFSISGQNVSGNLADIVYTYDASESRYKAAPVSFTIKLKGTEGEYTLGESYSSKIEYTDLDNETKAKSFPELEPRIVKFGMPKLKVLDVVKKGETVNVQLSVDLPERTDYGQIRLENGDPVFVNGSVGIIQNIESDGSYWYNGLSIYKTHKVFLWAVSDFDSDTTNQTELITIFNAIDIN
jgi:hypothetical protein